MCVCQSLSEVRISRRRTGCCVHYHWWWDEIESSRERGRDGEREGELEKERETERQRERLWKRDVERSSRVNERKRQIEKTDGRIGGGERSASKERRGGCRK